MGSSVFVSTCFLFHRNLAFRNFRMGFLVSPSPCLLCLACHEKSNSMLLLFPLAILFRSSSFWYIATDVHEDYVPSRPTVIKPSSLLTLECVVYMCEKMERREGDHEEVYVHVRLREWGIVRWGCNYSSRIASSAYFDLLFIRLLCFFLYPFVWCSVVIWGCCLFYDSHRVRHSSFLHWVLYHPNTNCLVNYFTPMCEWEPNLIPFDH